MRSALLWVVLRLEQNHCGARQVSGGENIQCRLTSFPGTGSRCVPAVTQALPADPLPTPPDWPNAPTRCLLHRRPRRAPSPALGTSRVRDGLRQCCCPMPQQGQGATASVLASLRLCPIHR